MDKQYLAEHNLLEAQKKFQKIVEYSFMGGKTVDEAGDPNDPNAGAPTPGGDPSMGGAPGGDPSMGGAPGGDPSMGGGMPGGDPSMGGAPGGDPSMGGAPAEDGAADGSQGVPEFQPQVDVPSMGGAPGGDPSMGEEDEDVIEIDDLTDSQKATEEKVDKLSDKLDRLEKFLDAFDKIESNIQANTEHLEQLRQDFEKRNPTQVEKMTLRAKQGYPFSQSPDEY